MIFRNMNTHPFLFLKQFFQNPKQIGAIAPTSSFTADIMTMPIKPDASVLEIGAGTGTITSSIIKRINRPNQLTSVEIDKTLAKEFKKDFPLVELVNQDVEQILQEEKTYDFIISGIPFVSMNASKRARVFQLVKNRLNPNGQFIAFQYSLYTKKELEALFPRVDIKFSLWNLPPAFIYFCKKS